MFYIIAGIFVAIVVWLLASLLVLPHVIYVLGIIVAVVLVLYGLWVLLLGGPRPPAGTSRGVRWR